MVSKPNSIFLLFAVMLGGICTFKCCICCFLVSGFASSQISYTTYTYTSGRSMDNGRPPQKRADGKHKMFLCSSISNVMTLFVRRFSLFLSLSLFLFNRQKTFSINMASSWHRCWDIHFVFSSWHSISSIRHYKHAIFTIIVPVNYIWCAGIHIYIMQCKFKACSSSRCFNIMIVCLCVYKLMR